MELFVGGTGQGKLTYVLQKYSLTTDSVADGAVCTMEELLQAVVINRFHLYLRRKLEQKLDIATEIEQLPNKLQDKIIIMDEVGCGIVPLDAFERRYREQVGRTSCILAQRASHVERVTCGMGCVLK